MSTWTGACQKKSSYKLASFSVILNLSIKKLWFCANFGIVLRLDENTPTERTFIQGYSETLNRLKRCAFDLIIIFHV